ncbi:hypothetical protein [Providencia phage PSTCR6]|nr:hypothetical protein [Providencia phage PSTCR6]
MNISVHWTGSYPTFCFGEWKIFIDGIQLTGIENADFKTAGRYDCWAFTDNWDEEWDQYEDGLDEYEWTKKLLTEDINGLKASLIRHGFELSEALISDLYQAISNEDWRHGSCGGCI